MGLGIFLLRKFFTNDFEYDHSVLDAGPGTHQHKLSDVDAAADGQANEGKATKGGTGDADNLEHVLLEEALTRSPPILIERTRSHRASAVKGIERYASINSMDNQSLHSSLHGSLQNSVHGSLREGVGIGGRRLSEVIVVDPIPHSTNASHK